MPRLNPPDKALILTLPPLAGIPLDQIMVPHTEAALQAAWDDLSGHAQLGFDTESKPTFVKGEVSQGPDVVQLATPSRAYVLQLRVPGVQALVVQVLTGPQILKVGFGLQQDRTQLRHRFGIEPEPLLDLDAVFHRQGYPKSLGIKSAVAVVFGQRFIKSKALTTTNWAQARLEPRQLQYAANDAFVALQVWQALQPGAAPAGARPGA